MANPPFFNNLLWLTPSRPSRGAWIETMRPCAGGTSGARRALHGARGLKHDEGSAGVSKRESRPSRGAWIETTGCPAACGLRRVAPFTGRVD